MAMSLRRSSSPLSQSDQHMPITGKIILNAHFRKPMKRGMFSAVENAETASLVHMDTLSSGDVSRGVRVVNRSCVLASSFFLSVLHPLPMFFNIPTVISLSTALLSSADLSIVLQNIFTGFWRKKQTLGT